MPMTRLLMGMTLLYGALKAVQWATRPRAGYAVAAMAWHVDLRRGEPWLLIGAIALPAILFAYATWWNDRWASRGFAHATGCVGRLTALDRLPNVYARFRRTAIADSAGSYYALALDQGRRLGLDRRRIDDLVARERHAHAGRYADLAAACDRPAIGAAFGSIDRCLHDEWPHDGLLNP